MRRPWPLACSRLRIAQRPTTPRHSFGYYRAEILANGAALVAVSLYVFMEVFQRFWAPPEVMGAPMMGIALGGLVVNLLALAVLHPGKSASLNLHGAWLHIMTDLLGSVAAGLGVVLIWAFG